ncbi:MAG: hypothetical protein IJP68_07420 [Selenomonadaceae bacterium]|nr:hypothetical protein [Selenomonadaceae bacterium]
MKHNIRINGAVKEIDCQLGSGILDKNGREIFEGHKVKATAVWDFTKHFTGEILFEDGSFTFLHSTIQTWFDDGYKLEIVDD